MKIFIIILTSFSIISCSSIRSFESPIKNGKPSDNDGLIYYMPKKDIIFKVTIADSPMNEDKVTTKDQKKVTKGSSEDQVIITTDIEKVTSINSKKPEKIITASFTTTPADRDESKQYTLRHVNGWFGKNTTNISITENGLLHSSKSTTISDVGSIFQNLATGYAKGSNLSGYKVRNLKMKPNSNNTVTKPIKCSANGEYIFIFSAKDPPNYTLCNFLVKSTYSNLEEVKENERIEKIKDKNLSHHSDVRKSYSGIYYRQNISFIMTATNSVDSLEFAQMLSVPSPKTLFLPISKTFFANNNAEFTFIDGVPTKYMQDVDGETIALLKIPSDVLGAYFSAVGSVFESFKKNDTSKIEALNASLMLEQTKQKVRACLRAGELKDDVLIESLGCKDN